VIFTSGTFGLELFGILWTRCIVFLYQIQKIGLREKPLQLDKRIFNSLLIIICGWQALAAGLSLFGRNETI